MTFAQALPCTLPPCQHSPKSPSLSTDFAHTWAGLASRATAFYQHLGKVGKPFHELAHTLPRLPPPFHDLAQRLVGACRHSTRDSPENLPTLCPSTCPHLPRTGPSPDRAGTSGRSWGRDRIGATWAESQWIVAARPLCHLQYPVAYLSRLQRILPAARREFLQGVPRGSSAAGVSPTTRAFGGRGPYCWSANGRRAHASLLARILT
ncbi:hypothetical protein QN277_007812 [Acacia crassicarpa]|uniref:Uncharacterized protein n=1 Tax=Acacia crassicarpa TaxID=499986 RepID=A0AAE1MAV3_9FABA|nr:hypothetical protein QN277_007790 [Acacia crassicarpa]KAK4258336.1 hypothetical protein QN277_007794 [Acacia crassicarpa]KAK4258340.1 hypothetical protein QN277_007798 [Acacia crassicarpa]KAK4258354.1 hypothetical protein QN277_007812 [Acacia crassicarpa]